MTRMAQVLAERLIGKCTVQLVRGDLTAETSAAIVNAANSQLMHGGGVAGAIARSGGPTIQEESDAWVRAHGPVTHESPAWTTAGSLPAEYVIHAVGPVWGEGDEEAKLEAAVRGSMRLAEKLGLDSVSLPAISTGIFGFPRAAAARAILGAIVAHVSERHSTIHAIRVVLMDEDSMAALRSAWDGPA